MEEIKNCGGCWKKMDCRKKKAEDEKIRERKFNG